MRDCVVVVPCFNEEKRIDTESFLTLLPTTRLLFVNDGSTDATDAVLANLVARGNGAITTLSLEQNSGKAEAVRRGLIQAAASGAPLVGFADSDLATPADEILRLIEIAQNTQAQVIMGSRVALAGANIERKLGRHYAGRVFATVASLVLQARFYDTQCGAKFFKNSELFRSAVTAPFQSRWIFDVELLGRLLTGIDNIRGLQPDQFLEIPLRRWADVEGSKLRLSSWVRAALDLGLISRQMATRWRH